MVFWITTRMKAKREQIKEGTIVINLFESNYARDLIYVSGAKFQNMIKENDDESIFV